MFSVLFLFYAIFAWVWEWLIANDLHVTYLCYCKCTLFAVLGRIYFVTVSCTSDIVNLRPLSYECVSAILQL